MTERSRVRVRYLGGQPIEVRGPATGAVHVFSGRQRAQLVDPRDAVAITRDKRFQFDGVFEVANS